VSNPWRGDIHDESGFNEFLVTAPPAGNVLTSVFRALRQRRDPDHSESIQPGREGKSPAKQDGVATSNEDEILLSETKAALKACLLL
jgi:POT family proton-dependent oligopeptide transporter